MVKVLGLAALFAVGRAATDVETAFEKFVRDFDRHYSSDHEKRTRFAVFKENYALVQAENAKGNSYTLGINGFADQTPEEFQGTHLGLSQSAPSWEGLPHLGTQKYSGVELPASVDWTQKGAVTPVKNQQQCGSCWAFSTTGAVEGAWQIASGKLVSLSEQQLVDCDHDSAGCGGGNMESSFTFLGKNNICTEQSYPYEAKNGKCRESNCTTGIPKGSIVGFKDVPEGDDNALMEAVSQQPVSVAIEADQAAFQLYKGGVLTKKCGDKLDHGVLLVGYGTEGGVDFWKVKNSWGPSWGEQGYVRLERGVKGKGECGIKANPSYPIMKKQSDLVV